MTRWTYQVRRDTTVFEDLAPWWDERSGPASTPYLRSEWFDLWCSSFLTAAGSLRVVSVERDGETVGVLPLMRTRRGWAALANSHTDVFDLVGDFDPDLHRAVDDWLRGRAVTRLYRLDGGSAIGSTIPTSTWLVDRDMRAPYIELGTDAETATARLSRSLRRDAGRRERRLAELGEVVYLDNAVDHLPDAVDQCLKLEASGWKGSEGTAITSRPETEAFYRGLMDLAQSRGWLRLSTLLIAERTVAFQLDLDYAGRRFSMKGGFDEELSHLSPGKVLQLKSLQSAASRGLLSYEFGGEAEPWKLEWTDSHRRRINVLVAGSRGAARVPGAVARFVARRRAVG